MNEKTIESFYAQIGPIMQAHGITAFAGFAFSKGDKIDIITCTRVENKIEQLQLKEIARGFAARFAAMQPCEITIITNEDQP